MPPRAGNVTMDCTKLRRELGGEGFQPWPLGDDIFPSDQLWHFDRPADEARALDAIRERLYAYAAMPATSRS